MIVKPYIAVFWTFTSAIDGQTYVSALLSENEEEIFATRNGTSGAADYATQSLLFADGGVPGSFNDISAGIAVDFVDGGKSWHFEITHTHVEFEAPQTSNDEYSRFVNTANGGEVGGKLWNGVANSEQNVIKVAQPIS